MMMYLLRSSTTSPRSTTPGSTTRQLPLRVPVSSGRTATFFPTVAMIRAFSAEVWGMPLSPDRARLRYTGQPDDARQRLHVHRPRATSASPSMSAGSTDLVVRFTVTGATTFTAGRLLRQHVDAHRLGWCPQCAHRHGAGLPAGAERHDSHTHPGLEPHRSRPLGHAERVGVQQRHLRPIMTGGPSRRTYYYTAALKAIRPTRVLPTSTTPGRSRPGRSHLGQRPDHRHGPRHRQPALAESGHAPHLRPAVPQRVDVDDPGQCQRTGDLRHGGQPRGCDVPVRGLPSAQGGCTVHSLLLRPLRVLLPARGLGEHHGHSCPGLQRHLRRGDLCSGIAARGSNFTAFGNNFMLRQICAFYRGV